MRITEDSIIPYNVDFKALRQNMQNGTVYPNLNYMTRTSSENRMGGFQSFDTDLMFDFDTNITMICEEFPKISKDEVLAKIDRYISNMFAKYKTIVTERFYVGMYNACMQKSNEYIATYGTGCPIYVIINDRFIINPMYVYGIIQNRSPKNKTQVYAGVINE